KVPLANGENLVTISAGNRKNVRAEQMLILPYNYNAAQNLRISDSRTNPTLTLDYPRIRSEQVVLSKNLHLSFTVGGQIADGLTCEIKNNGVAIYRESIQSKHGSDKTHRSIRVPLMQGLNNIELEARNRIGETESITLRVFHRVPQTVKAVLVGINSYAETELDGKLQYAVNDVQELKSMLLSFTDAEPSDISVLTDRSATADAFKQL